MPEQSVSVVIPSYNAALYLPAAIDSLIGQTVPPSEILVVDDGSSDGTESVVEKYGARVRYIRQANQGVSVARNRGIAESRGHYVGFLDADDIWYPNKLERQLEAMAGKPDCRVSYSAYSLVDSDLNPIDIRRSPRCGTELEDLLLIGNFVGSISGMLCEKALLEIVGGFDPHLSQCADWDMNVRLARHAEFLYIDEPLVVYRQHANNMSRNAPLMEHDSLFVLEKAFALPDLPSSLRSRRREAFGRNYMVLAGTYFHAHRVRDFVRCISLALASDIRQVSYPLNYPFRIAMRFVARRGPPGGVQALPLKP